MAYALAATLVFDIVLNILMIPYFQREYDNGGIGAAITTLLAEVVMVVIAVRLMPRGLFDRRTKLMFGKIFIATALLAGIGLLSFPTGLSSLVTVAIGGIIYLGLIFSLRIYSLQEVRHVLKTASGRAGTGAGISYESSQSS